MTPSSPRSWSSTVASLRKASDGCLAGGREAFGHFERYVNLLFCLTVADEDSAIRLSRNRSQPLQAVLTAGHDPSGKPVLRLADGRFLRLVTRVHLDPSSGGALRVDTQSWHMTIPLAQAPRQIFPLRTTPRGSPRRKSPRGGMLSMHRRVGDDLTRRYRNAPIAEAVCELRLDPGLPWDSATPGLLWAPLRERYPERREDLLMEARTDTDADAVRQLVTPTQIPRAGVAEARVPGGAYHRGLDTNVCSC